MVKLYKDKVIMKFRTGFMGGSNNQNGLVWLRN